MLAHVRLWLSGLLLVGGLTAAAPASAAWSDIVVFGDSLSDVGNVRQRSLDVTFGLFPTPDNRYDRGRFSNGDVWVEFVGDALGLDASTRSDRAEGTNYAYGGATTANGSSNFGIVRNLGWQIDEYLEREARMPSADTLVVLWAGGNNYLDGGTDTAGATNDLIGSMQRLFDAGARNFLVPNLPPLGETPRFVNNATSRPQRNAITAQHNLALDQSLTSFAAGRDVAVYPLDIESLFFDLLAEPTAYGITNTTAQAITATNTDVAGFLFWDDVHPTTTGHRLIADAALALLRGPGDYNASGSVEQGDLDLVLNNWGGPRGAWNNVTGFTTAGVDQEELDRVLNHWGSTNIPNFNTIDLPEPAGTIVLLIANALRVRRRGGA